MVYFKMNKNMHQICKIVPTLTVIFLSMNESQIKRREAFLFRESRWIFSKLLTNFLRSLLKWGCIIMKVIIMFLVRFFQLRHPTCNYDRKIIVRCFLNTILDSYSRPKWKRQFEAKKFQEKKSFFFSATTKKS